jgi:hypothetical protein
MEMHVNQRTLHRQGNNDIQMANIFAGLPDGSDYFLRKKNAKKWKLFDQMFIKEIFKNDLKKSSPFII